VSVHERPRCKECGLRIVVPLSLTTGLCSVCRRDAGARFSGPWQWSACTEPTHWHRDVGDRCSRFSFNMTGAICVSRDDPNMTLPEGVPYPDHGWKYVLTCTAHQAQDRTPVK
jgi:hypothetical protein